LLVKESEKLILDPQSTSWSGSTRKVNHF